MRLCASIFCPTNQQDLNKTMPTRCASMLNSSGPIFSTMSHPSPLDRIRTSKKALFSSVELSHSMPDQKCLMNRSLPEIWRELKGKNEGIKEEEDDGDTKDEQWTGRGTNLCRVIGGVLVSVEL